MARIVQDTSGCRDLDSYDTGKYSRVEQDSNTQSTTTTGGEDHLVVRTGGADDQRDTGASGGRSIG